MPMHSLLSSAAYWYQFCLSVSCAAVSSPRQAFLSRPRTTDPIAAASQLGSTLSVGGPPVRTRTFCPRDGRLARACTFFPRGDTLSGCGSPREPSTGFSSRATSGGRSLTVGCLCPIGACGCPIGACGAAAPIGFPCDQAELAARVTIAMQTQAERMTLSHRFHPPPEDSAGGRDRRDMRCVSNRAGARLIYSREYTMTPLPAALARVL